LVDAAIEHGESAPTSVYYPEIVMCLSAAVGTDTTIVSDAISSELRIVGYQPVLIRLSSLMAQIPGLEYLSEIRAEDERIRESMKAGNEIRRIIGHANAVARLALSEIHRVRASLNDSEDITVPAERHCFIISSLKRDEELEMLRKLFGQRVLLVSVYEPREQRVENLCRKIASSKNSADPEAHRDIANGLIDTDQKERTNLLGQRLEDVFQKADVFLKSGISFREDVRRFIQLLFQAPYITPTVDEILMFQARATAQRSADLSRQVGAVIATKTGEILATGCNEVPRAGGGVNWDLVAGSERDYRDYKIGLDAAAGTRKEIVGELLQALADANWLVEDKSKLSSEDRAQEALYGKPKSPLDGTAVASLLEFGRIVHAEMAAVCDAANEGCADSREHPVLHDFPLSHVCPSYHSSRHLSGRVH
jgi:deoxycytidylate deaminase